MLCNGENEPQRLAGRRQPHHGHDAAQKRFLAQDTPRVHRRNQALTEEVAGDFTAAVIFVGKYKTLYDQAGLMVRVDAQHWMKCGIEYVHGVQYAPAVVTSGLLQDYPPPLSPAPALSPHHGQTHGHGAGSLLRRR
ncbi:MAG: DUF1349 domain-containing protein [Caldilineaceae bacterium]